MTHVYLDTNIIIDYLVDRRPWSDDANILFEAAEDKKIKTYTSALSFAILHYVLKKNISPKRLKSALRELSQVISIISINEEIICSAIESNQRDFEDAIQQEAAIRHKRISILVTRNHKDFSKNAMAIMSAKETVSALGLNRPSI